MKVRDFSDAVEWGAPDSPATSCGCRDTGYACKDGGCKCGESCFSSTEGGGFGGRAGSRRHRGLASEGEVTDGEADLHGYEIGASTLSSTRMQADGDIWLTAFVGTPSRTPEGSVRMLVPESWMLSTTMALAVQHGCKSEIIMGPAEMGPAGMSCEGSCADGSVDVGGGYSQPALPECQWITDTPPPGMPSFESDKRQWFEDRGIDPNGQPPTGAITYCGCAPDPQSQPSRPPSVGVAPPEFPGLPPRDPEYNAAIDWCSDMLPLALVTDGMNYCCYLHDKCYGPGGSEQRRRACDTELAECLMAETGVPLIAFVYGFMVMGYGWIGHWDYHMPPDPPEGPGPDGPMEQTFGSPWGHL